MPTTSPSTLFDLAPDAVECPHRFFAELRRKQPVFWSDQIEAFVVSRYDDIVQVTRHSEVFSSRMATGPILDRQITEVSIELAAADPDLRGFLETARARGRTPALVNADPPLHSRQRSLVNRAFTPRKVQRWEPTITRLVDALIDQFVDQGHVELVQQFAVPLPMTVIAEALGVATDRTADFKCWSDDFVGAIGNHLLGHDELARMIRSQAEFFTYFADVIEERRADPGDDLVSDVVHARIDGESLSTAEMLAMFSQFLVAGNETTTKLIASAMLHIARRPDLADQLRTDPDMVKVFVEEVLRLEAPVQGLYRVAVEDTELGGVPIPAGSSLWLVYASGNRDEDHFAGADECRLNRTASSPHLAFGQGEHFCLGASLARGEARIAIERLLARLHDIRLADQSDLEYEPSYVLHGLRRLPLEFTAAGNEAS